MRMLLYIWQTMSVQISQTYTVALLSLLSQLMCMHVILLNNWKSTTFFLFMISTGKNNLDTTTS